MPGRGSLMFHPTALLHKTCAVGLAVTPNLRVSERQIKRKAHT